jgi:hypothetical protein
MKFGVALTAVLVCCSYAVSAQSSVSANEGTHLIAQNPSTTPAPAGTPTAPGAAGTTPGATTGTTPTVSHSTKHHHHKKVKLKKQKPKKHHKPKAHKIKVHHVAGTPIQGGVTHKHVHKPLSSSQQSQLNKLENAISNPSSNNPANTSKIGTPSNSLPPVSP